MTATRESILSALSIRAVPFVLPGGITVRIREMSVRERLDWRRASLKDNGELVDDWALRVVQVCTLLPDVDEPLWPTVDQVDGPDAVLSALVQEVLRVNGLAAGAVKEEAENFPESPISAEHTN